MIKIRLIMMTVMAIVLVSIIGCETDIENGEEDGNVPVQPSIGQCVPEQCCHPTSCVLKQQAPDCAMTMCTMDCKPETMDCGQGHCETVGNECVVVWT